MIEGKNIQFEYVSDKGILVKKHFGDVSITDITGAWDWAVANKIVPKGTNKFLLDYREALIQDIAKTTEMIIKYYRSKVELFADAKVAIVSTNPKNIALTMLMCRTDDGYTVKPFTEYEMAIEWLSE